jgi:hypothetical protein
MALQSFIPIVVFVITVVFCGGGRVGAGGGMYARFASCV